MTSQQSQISRILSMCERLCKGHVLTKKTEADSFHVTAGKTITTRLGKHS